MAGVVVESSRIRLTACEVDLGRRTVHRQGSVDRLTGREAALFGYLAAHPHETVTREDLLVHVWGYHHSVVTRAIDSTMFRLRKKVELDASHPDHLLASYGTGFVFVPATPEGATPEWHPPAEREGNVPPRFNRFFGRAAELGQIARRLAAGARLVTVCGTAGVGKTRLAQEFAAVHWDGPAWFVDLSDARFEAEIVSRIVSVLGLEEPRRDAAQLGVALAAFGDALLVLDNLEQAVDAARPVAHQLLRAPRLRLLCTSRRPLDVDAEERVSLGGLDPQHARELFVDRARAGRPDHAATERDLDELIERIDALPFAIELAAARTRMLTVRQLLARLSVDALGRAAEGKHLTIRDTIAWSWSLLNPDAQQALMQLAHFEGTFSADAVEDVVVTPGADPLDLLQLLIEHSLVDAPIVEEAPDEVRFRLFHSVREFAREKRMADPEAHRACIDRAARHFARVADELARGWTGEPEDPRRPVLSLDAPNLRAVFEDSRVPHGDRIRCGLALFEAYGLCSPIHGVITIGEQLLREDLGPDRPRVAWGVLRARAAVGRLDQAIADGRELFASLPADKARVEVGLGLEMLLRRRGHNDEALALLREVKTLAQACGLPVQAAACDANESSLLLVRGSLAPDELEARFGTARAIMEAGGYRWLAATTVVNQGHLAVLRGDPDAARLRFEDSVGRFEALGMALPAARARLLLAALLVDMARIDEATALVEHARRVLAREGVYEHSMGPALVGRIEHARGNLVEADLILRDATNLARAEGATYRLVAILCARVEVALDRGQREIAEACVTEVRQIAEVVGAGPVSHVRQRLERAERRMAARA